MDIKKLVYDIYAALRAEFNLQETNLTDDTVVFGAGGISSLQLVRLIVELEDEIIDQTRRHINLTDDKVLSLKHSPFANLGALVPFVVEKVKASQV